MTVTQHEQNDSGSGGPGRDGPASGVSKTALALIWFETATLAIVAPMHLAGLLGNGPKLNPGAAGAAEAVIAVVLAAAAIAAWRMPAQARALTVGATCFAIVGFGLGLSITARSGDAFDVAYHAIMLPVLIVTLVLLLRPGSTTGG